MKTPFYLLLFVSCIVSAAPTPPDENNLILNGFGSASVWGGSKDYRLNTLYAQIALQGEYKKGKAYMSTDLRLKKGNSFGSDFQTIAIHKLVVGYQAKSLDLLLGYQTIEWGRTDGFNPTNYLQAYDYFFLSADPADQKKSSLALRSRFRLHNIAEIELVAQPFYLPSVYRYDLFDLGTSVRFTDPQLPASTWRNGSAAGRINFELPGIGFSVSGFRGYDPYHGFRVHSVDWTNGLPQLTLQSASYLKTSLGSDFSVSAGSFVVKAEAAWNHSSRVNDEMEIPGSHWMYVAGIETAIGASTLITNYIGYFTPRFTPLEIPLLSDPMNPLAQLSYANAMIEYENRQLNRRIFHQYKKNNHALSITWLRKFVYDALEAQLTAYYDITSGELMARPTVKWFINDQLLLIIGAHYMKGDESTLFSYSSQLMNGGFAELRVNF